MTIRIFIICMISFHSFIRLSVSVYLSLSRFSNSFYLWIRLWRSVRSARLLANQFWIWLKLWSSGALCAVTMAGLHKSPQTLNTLIWSCLLHEVRLYLHFTLTSFFDYQISNNLIVICTFVVYNFVIYIGRLFMYGLKIYLLFIPCISNTKWWTKLCHATPERQADMGLMIPSIESAYLM